jgi:aldose 1-epimerase
MTYPMIYQHRIEPFGAFEKHIFENEQGDGFDMVPQYGACLLDLRFGGISVLDGFKTPEEMVAGAWGKNIVLFPFPNRLRDGRYTHEGKTYQFDLNNADTQNAIHGFGNTAPMVIRFISLDSGEGEGDGEEEEEEGYEGYDGEGAMIHCAWIHDGSHSAYPFAFAFDIVMRLKNKEFHVEMAFTNHHSTAIPVGLGWHPYFVMSENVGDTSLKMPQSELILIDNRMLPTGEKQAYTAFDTLTKIGDTSLDNGFFVTETGKKAEVTLQSERGKLTYWQELGEQKWNFLQVFTPPHRKSIALEPMTCNIDAFNNKDGLIVLQPDTSIIGSFGVRFSNNTTSE